MTVHINVYNEILGKPRYDLYPGIEVYSTVVKVYFKIRTNTPFKQMSSMRGLGAFN